MRTWLMLAGLTLSLAALPQEIYRWVDRNGVVHYSDQPGVAGAERVILTGPNVYESTPSDLGVYRPGDGDDYDAPPPAAYESLSIVQPQPDQVFFGANATVPVAVELGGTLQPDHSLVFFVNGNRRPAADGLGLELTDLNRGSHFLRASVLDQHGEPLITSQQITFHVREPSVLSPQSPQARPRPTPQPGPPPTGT